jgi:uncharacterized glyoxalase superfamily protein PhnB
LRLRADELPNAALQSAVTLACARVHAAERRHYAQANAAGATILSPPEDKFWGDRSYNVIDCEGYRWTFRKIAKNVRLPDSKPK